MKLMLKLILLALVIVGTVLIVSFRGQPQCSDAPPFMLRGTVYDCGAGE